MPVLTGCSGSLFNFVAGRGKAAAAHIQADPRISTGVPRCFAHGTLIATPEGFVAVEDLRVGDLVLTADHGPRALRWIGRRHEGSGADDAAHRPVRIAQGALGPALPEADLVVSPHQHVVLAGPEVRALFGRDEVLAPAGALTGLPGVRRMQGPRSVDHYALLLDRHEVIFANGMPTESLRPGPIVMAGFEPDVRAAIHAIYPRLKTFPIAGLGPPARPIIRRRDVDAWVSLVEKAAAGQDTERRDMVAEWDSDARRDLAPVADQPRDRRRAGGLV